MHLPIPSLKNVVVATLIFWVAMTVAGSIFYIFWALLYDTYRNNEIHLGILAACTQSFVFATECALTSWLGFFAAGVLQRVPSKLLCSALGVAFMMVSTASIHLLPFGFFLGPADEFVVEGFQIAAPIFVFLGCVIFTRPVQTANPPLNADARPETPRAG